ncbi:MAG: acyl carrier protein [Actinomycetota bacterium]|nr:acyl carrier protein [Actinomycetota bacterium]
MSAPPSPLAADLVKLIADEVAVHDEEPVETDTDLLLTGLVDSLGVIQIVGWLEDRLGITIEPADVTLDHFQTVERMVTYVTTRHGVDA